MQIFVIRHDFSVSATFARRLTTLLTAVLLAAIAFGAQAQTISDNQSDELTNRIGGLPGQSNEQGMKSMDAPHDGLNATEANGPVQLRGNQQNGYQSRYDVDADRPIELPPYKPSEFERYVADSVSSHDPVRRFGSNLLTDSRRPSAGSDPLPLVPGNYVVKPGDEVVLTIWGSVNADLRLTVDRSGLISVPRIGSINVGGVRFADLSNAVKARIGQIFHNFDMTVSIGQVRPARIFVSGYVQRPGSVTISGLASILQAVMRAGGPSAAGSFRDIRLTRGGQQIATYDLYDLLLRNDHRVDELIQPDDIIFVGPLGTQVAAVGSVNQPAIFELKPGEHLEELLAMAGGFSAVADRSRVSIERIADRNTGRVQLLTLPQHQGDALATGDIVWAFSAVDTVLTKTLQNKRVHIDGEVARPGEYILPPNGTLSDVLAMAGGMTSAAFPYATEFTRKSVRKTQEANYDRALRELETSMTMAQTTTRVTSVEEASAKTESAMSSARLLSQLRELRPTGRVILDVEPADRALPELLLEDGDSIRIPARDTSVGVFGSVFSSGSFVFHPGRNTSAYLRLAGGPTKGADKRSMFVIHANGAVVSAQQGASFWHSGNEFETAQVEPGDTIFVPEELDKTTFVQGAKDWTQILYQFGLGVAGIKAVGL